MDGIVHATFVDLKDESLLSPDTSEFVTLERQILEQQPNFIIGSETGSATSEAPQSPHSSASSSFRKTSEEVQREMEAEEQQRQILQSELEEKLEERKRSMELGSSENGLQLMERRQFRQFSRADEYLYAMKEDLAEWMNNLYPHIDMDADNFMNRLETGEHLVQHANMVRQKCLDLLDLIAEGKTKQRPPTFEVPERELPCRFNVQPTTWFARDNVFNFILFCRRLGVMECIMFETEDLVCRKNEKHVILTLLEVARRGAKLGMLAPMLVQFEQEIDREIAREERQKRKEEKEEEKRRKDEDRKLAEVKRRRELEEAKEAAKEAAAAKMAAALGLNNNGLIGGPNGHGGLHGANGLGFANGLGSGADCVFDSMQVEFDVDDDLNMADVEDGNDMDEDDLDRIDEDEDDEEEEEDEEDDTTCFGYDMPIGPLPQQVTNDLKSLDEMVRELVAECQCPTQFPIIQVSEGKYRIGESQTLIFVRILRNHVMVRVGGGWDTLQHYLDKHDPCRCKAGHKSASHAQITVKNGRNGSIAPVGVCYDRSDSSPRRRSSTTNLNTLGRRSSSLTPNNHVNSGSAININNKVISSCTPNSRSSSSQQLQVGSASSVSSHSNKARAMYAKQGSACLLLQNAQVNSSGSLIPTPNLTKTGSKSSLAKPAVGSSLQQANQTGFNMSRDTESKKSKDTLSTCDSSSEVSDEGYKSSQGNVGNSASPNGGRTMIDLSGKSGCTNEASSHEGDRPESSLTVASECSSTISSEGEAGAASKEGGKDPPEGPPKAPPSPTNSSISDDEDVDGGDTWNTPTNQSTPIKDLNTTSEAASAGSTSSSATAVKVEEKKSNGGRFASLFNNMKIPKFRLKSNKDSGSEPSSLETTPVKSSLKEKPTFSRSNSAMSTDLSSGGAGGSFVRNTKERHSYRAPSATSRYMQAAEAYAAKSRASRSNSGSVGPGPAGPSVASAGGGGTWSAGSLSSNRGRSRPQLTNETFQRPPSRGYNSRPASRTTSASPGPLRRRQPSDLESKQSSSRLNPPSSTHSTPAKKPMNRSDSRSSRSEMISATASAAKSQKTLADLDLDEEDAILKRMEEILLTYKSRVETHLAAEGRELPKEIFEDFTSQWVATSTAASSRPISRSATAELNPRMIASATPSPRKAKRDSSSSRIPVPTFYDHQ